MVDARPFRGLRFDPVAVDPARTIAPPYDVISPAEQRALYERDPHNIVRVEYGAQRSADDAGDNRYTRAARDLAEWTRAGVLVREAQPAFYAYRQTFTWRGRTYTRSHWFAAVRLEPWTKGDIKPHERTLSAPKADRLDLLRATRTQVSPVYCLVRDGLPDELARLHGSPLYDFDADGQHHTLEAVTDRAAQLAIARYLAAHDLYIADGHHRYETALKYRDERKEAASSWTGDEPENFVLMAVTAAADHGLLVLPTHRIVRPAGGCQSALAKIGRAFSVEDLTPEHRGVDVARLLGRLRAALPHTAFVAIGLESGQVHLLTLRDRAAIDALMPAGEPDAWKRLDVSLLQYGILRDVFGIDDAALATGAAVSYTQDAQLASDAVARDPACVAFLLNATPVEQVLAVADAGGRMPQKSTYFYPKLPTGLVMNALAGE